ncbi:MAG TPA: MlaD family protein [Myxococcota bacterium]|nr:MlaD family protein [Myxococcota bacterium]
MSEREPGRVEEDDVASAVVEERRRPSIVWLIPIVAAVVGGFVAWRAFSERGPEITITFKTAEGLEAGKTHIKYKDVEVGLVDSVVLSPDLSGVIVKARMAAGAEDYLREKTQFWIVKPRVSGGQVSGLGTLFSGAYIGMDPVREGRTQRDFEGLEEQPIVSMQEPGRFFVLRSRSSGAVDVGSPVLYQRIQVGQVVSSELDPEDDFVTTRVFVREPYDRRVHPETRFWNASGIDVSVSADGVKIDTQSLVSILIGGIAFDEPPDSTQEPASAETLFPLYANREAAEQRHYTRSVTWMLRFDQSVRGLKIGAPVEFRGIEVGRVTDLRLEFDQETAHFRIPVLIEIEPERFMNVLPDEKLRREIVDRVVASGLRAQLRTGNLLTGQLIVAMDIYKDAKPAQVVWTGPVPEMPTIPTPIEEITGNLTRLVERLGNLPVEQIGKELHESLESLKVTLARSEDVGPALASTLAQAQKTLASANTLISPDSNVNSEMRRALLELSDAARALGLAADQIQTQPNSVIFGKKGHP